MPPPPFFRFPVEPSENVTTRNKDQKLVAHYFFRAVFLNGRSVSLFFKVRRVGSRGGSDVGSRQKK
jgi:hypothetical protein